VLTENFSIQKKIELARKPQLKLAKFKFIFEVEVLRFTAADDKNLLNGFVETKDCQ